MLVLKFQLPDVSRERDVGGCILLWSVLVFSVRPSAIVWGMVGLSSTPGPLHPAPDVSTGPLGAHFSPPTIAVLPVEKALMSILYYYYYLSALSFIRGKPHNAIYTHLMFNYSNFSLASVQISFPFSLSTYLPTYPPIYYHSCLISPG